MVGTTTTVDKTKHSLLVHNRVRKLLLLREGHHSSGVMMMMLNQLSIQANTNECNMWRFYDDDDDTYINRYVWLRWEW